MRTPDLPPDFDRQCHRRATWIRVWEDLVVRGDPHPAGGRVWAALSVGLPSAIDRFTRHLDRQVGRSFHGRWQRLFAQAHSSVPWLFMLTAILFTMLGPTPRWRGLGPAVAMAAALVAYVGLVRVVPARTPHGRGLFTLQLVLLASLNGLLLLLADPSATEATPAPYRHVFAPVLLLLMVVAALAFPLAAWVLGGLRERHAELLSGLLARTELFDTPRPPEPSLRRFLHGLVNAPLYHPLHLLLLPALPMVLVPRDHAQPMYAAGWLVMSWLVLTFAGMYDRLNLAIRVIKRQFLIGGQGLVSIAIIVLAALRLAEVDYVSTLLDTASAQVVSYYIAAAYSAFWLYEYWINRALAERLLPLLRSGAPPDTRVAWAPYPVQPDVVASRVQAEGRAVEVFAGGRFVVTGAYVDPDTRTTCGQWQPYERGELFQRLADTAHRESDADTRYAVNMAVSEVDKRSKLYFNLLNVVLLALALGGGLALQGANKLNHQWPGTTVPLLTTPDAPPQPVDLRARVFVPQAEPRPKILLAVSGGGTRAALYAASVLRGLALHGRAGDVVLVSGVSGGGAALAYFALHRGLLLSQVPRACGPPQLKALADQPQPQVGEDVWCRFLEVMARPYIDDVLRGVSELQVMGRKTTGHLLQESLTRSLAPPAALADPSSIDGLGVILNTTLAGQPAAAPDGSQAAVPCPSAASSSASRPSREQLSPDGVWHGTSAGGILAFTNLRHVAAFPAATGALPCAPDERLPYVLAGVDASRLIAAAALSANFPPVFPNAAVDVARRFEGQPVTRRYWVTDGGAAENRGAVSLLYALHGMLDACVGAPMCDGPRPDLHLVVADASALSFDYHRDRGLGAITGSAGKLSGQLMVDLVASAEGKYLRKGGGKLSFSYLPMPTLLRARGGLGTHWAMPGRVTLSDDTGLEDKRADALVVLDRWDTIALLACLHPGPPAGAPPQDACAPFDQGRLGERLRASPHTRAWASLSSSLSPPPAHAR